MKQDRTNTVRPRSCSSNSHSETSSDAFRENKEEKGNNIYCVSLYWLWGSWVNHVNSLTLSFFLFKMWIIVSLSSKGCCGEIQWKTTLHTQLYCVVSRSVMSDSCDPIDYSLPGSSVHGILNTQQIAPTSRAIWQQHGCPLIDLRMKICSSFL